MNLNLSTLRDLDLIAFGGRGHQAAGASHAIARHLVAKRKPVALLLALLAGQLAPLPLGAQEATFDASSFAQRITLWAKTDLQESIRAAAKESKDQMRWLTDAVQVYRNIKLARAAYESIATFDLAANVNIVDLIPSLPLPEGYLFGGPDSGFQSTPDADKFPSLRLIQRQGGAAATFQNWPKFAPNLKIDPKALAQQLSNIDFDTSATVQYKDSSGLPIGSAIAERDPKARAGKLMAFFESSLAQLNAWADQQATQAAMTTALQAEAASEMQWLNREQQQLTSYYQTEREATYKSFGLIPDQDLELQPFAQALRQANAAAIAAKQASVQNQLDQITALKSTRDARQSLITTEVELKNLLGEAQSIQTKESEQIASIIQRYGATAALPVPGPLGAMVFGADATTKLPPQGQAEVQRLQQANANALAIVSAKIQVAKAGAENTAQIDNISRDLQDRLNALKADTLTRSSDALFLAVEAARKADLNSRTSLNRLDAAARDAAQQKQAQTLDTIAALSQSVLGQAGAQAAPWKLVENLCLTYGRMIKTFFGNVSLADAMTPTDDGLTQAMKDVQATWNKA